MRGFVGLCLNSPQVSSRHTPLFPGMVPTPGVTGVNDYSCLSVSLLFSMSLDRNVTRVRLRTTRRGTDVGRHGGDDVCRPKSDHTGTGRKLTLEVTYERVGET